MRVQRNKGNHKGIPNNMKMKALFAVTAMLALTACAGQELGNARGVQANSSAFGNALSAGYLRLAQAEYAEGDYADSDYFALRSIAAGTSGTTVELPAPDARSYPDGSAADVAKLNADLKALLDAGAGDKEPELAATAKIAYECWTQELEENMQPAEIAACRKQLEGLIPALRNAIAVPKATKPVKGKLYKVLFGNGSARLDDAANAVITEAAKHAGSYNPPRLVVSGYTDTSGSASANQALSERRAAVVAAALRLRGVPREAIKTNAYGERFPDVRTGDGVSEAKNRRVEISVAP